MIGAAAVIFSGSVPARAQTSVDQCLASASDGQSARDRGKLLDARRAFATCTETACPEPVRKDCAAWLTELEKKIPSVIVKPSGPDGSMARGAICSLDGEAINVDGRAHPVDPGAHVFRCGNASANGRVTLLVSEGDTARRVDVPLEAPARARSRALPYSFFGVAVAGLGFGSFMAAQGFSEYSTLSDTCRGACPPDEVSGARTKMAVGEVAIGVGIVAGVLATYLLLTGAPSPSNARTAQ